MKHPLRNYDSNFVLINYSGFPTGFCDRLRAITFAIAVCEINNLCKIKLNYDVTPESPWEIEKLIAIENISLERTRETESLFCVEMTPHDSSPSFVNALVHNGVFRPFSSFKLLLLWKRAYTRLRPADDLGVFESPSIGVHIRSGDKLSDRVGLLSTTQEEVNYFIQTVVRRFVQTPDVGKSSSLPAAYIASETSEIHNSVVNVLLEEGYRVINRPRNWSRNGIRTTDSRALIEDLFILSRCNKIYSNLGGGVPHTAHLISGRKAQLINFSRRSIKRFLWVFMMAFKRRLIRILL